MEGTISKAADRRESERCLRDKIQKAIDNFLPSKWISTILCGDAQGRFRELGRTSTSRCARELGAFVQAA